MPIVVTSLSTTLSPAEVLKILTDFGPGRVEAFPGVSDSNFTLHDSGDTWADVTEGNKIGWERERYDWDAAAGTITAVTTDSNLWGPGSRWDYRLIPEGGGTRVEIRLERHAKGVLGHLVGLLVPIGGKRMITTSFTKALKAAAT
jgi:Polyketide cyclase / dehydrase and lipid transport